MQVITAERAGSVIGAAVSDTSARIAIDSGASRLARTLSSTSARASRNVSPEKPAKSMVTCGRSNAASICGRRHKTLRVPWRRTCTGGPSGTGRAASSERLSGRPQSSRIRAPSRSKIKASLY